MVMALCVTFSSLPADMAAAAELPIPSEIGILETEALEEAVSEEKEAEAEETPGAEIEELGTEAVEALGTELPETNAAESGKPESTETPGTEATESTEALEPESSETELLEETEGESGKPESTEALEPEAEETELLEETETERTEVSETEDARQEEPESTEVLETEAVEAPETELLEETEGSETEDAQQEEAESTEESESQEASLNFIMVESADLQTPGTQRVVVSVGSGETEPSEWTLTYQNLTTGKEYTVAAEAVAQDMALFSMKFEDAQMAGVYQILRVSCRFSGETATIEIPEQEMNVKFGVNTEVAIAPDQVLYDEKALASVEADVITMDENGNILSENTAEYAADGGLMPESILHKSSLKYASGSVVVVLDPGHDDTHAGAQQNGAGEEDLVLKIAQYCKEELSTYNGISVYMTRTGGSCPNGGSSVTSGTCNEKRVEYAKSVGANLYVSFHLNSAESSSVNGVAVYYPNSNYQAQIGAVGESVATTIYHKLAALGLSAWGGSGIKIWNASYDKYPDGSAADYLGVIRNCKKAGIPAVLIEHAFLSGTSDYYNFLNSDEKLKNLGLADAAAIADYYGLSKGAPKPEIQYVKSLNNGKLRIHWAAVTGSASYEVWRSTSASKGYQRIAKVSDGTTYTDGGVETGKKYYYQVCAVGGGGAAGEKSDAVSGTALAAPQISSVCSKSSKQIEIAWGSVKGAEGYLIFRQNEKTGAYEQIGKTDSADALSYIDKVSADNQNYSYKVQAFHMAKGQQGVGILSDAVEGKSLAKTKITSIVSKNETTLSLTWKKVKGADGYEISRSTKKGSGYKKIAVVNKGATVTYQDSKVKKATVYYYKIQAFCHGNGGDSYSGDSAVVSGKTVAKTKITSVEAKSETSLKISWKKVSGATGYRVKRSSSKNGTYKVIKNISSKNTTSYVDNNVKKGTAYYYKVEAVSKADGIAGYSGDSAAVEGNTVSKTSISYVVSLNSSTLEISWKKVSGAWGYRVKRSDSAKGTYKTIKTIQGAGKTTYQDKKRSAGKTYYYKVETINKIGNKKGYSGDSSAVSGKALAAPQITEMEATSSTSMLLTWKKVSGSNGYQIYRSTSKNSGYKKIATVNGANAVSYEDAELSAGKTYYYKIRAFKKNSKKNEYSSYSGVKKAWTLKKVTLAGVADSAETGVAFKWKKVSNASQYSIYRSTSAGKGFKKIATVSANKLTYTDQNVKAGNVYYYKVAANNSITAGIAGTGDYSEVIGIPVLAKATMGTISLKENNSIRVSWKKVEKASGYELAYSTKENGSYTVLSKSSATSFQQKGIKQGLTYYYKVRAYVTLEDGSLAYGAWSHRPSL